MPTETAIPQTSWHSDHLGHTLLTSSHHPIADLGYCHPHQAAHGPEVRQSNVGPE